jgi:hypothetical protein
VGVGSGQPGNPWARTHRANSRTSFASCGEATCVGWPPLGSKCLQVFMAAWYTVLLTPRSWGGGNFPTATSSGKLSTPRARMQLEKASVDWDDESDELGVDEPGEANDDAGGLVDRPDATPGAVDPPPQADAARETTVATTVNLGAPRGQARRIALVASRPTVRRKW